LRIYLAGPLGFSEAGRAFVPRLKRVLAAKGHRVVDPFALTDTGAAERMRYGAARRAAWRKLNRTIAANNRAAIDRCDAIVAVLDGTDVDSGTAAEIGYGFAVGKPIVGYRGDFRLAADNDGAAVNLQVEYFIRESGGDIVSAVADLPKALAKSFRSRDRSARPARRK
jgi:nucleoside 2-deoxyribosyltransferase